MNELKTSIEQLYRVFANYPLAQVVEGCSCCVEVKDHLALRTAPLRDLPAENLTHYASHALTTWGTEEDFKHFLPRILELVSAGAIMYDAEIIIGKLGYANWLKWPEEEQLAVKGFLMSVWKELLMKETHPLEASDWICCVGIIGEDLQPYLELWVEARSKVAYGRLLEAVQDGWILQNAFWDDVTSGPQQVRAWLEARETAGRLMEIYYENEAADFAKTLAECIDALNAFQKG